jgi:hypothetical protein
MGADVLIAILPEVVVTAVTPAVVPVTWEFEEPWLAESVEEPVVSVAVETAVSVALADPDPELATVRVTG